MYHGDAFAGLEEGIVQDLPMTSEVSIDDPSLAPKRGDFILPMSLTPTHKKGDLRKVMGFKYEERQ